MNKKKSVMILLTILAFAFIYSLSFITPADTNTTTATNLSGFDLSYSCLKDRINSVGIVNMTTEQLAFSLLAMGYDSTLKTKIRNELDSRDSSDGCWPNNGCKVKETALIILAYDHIGADTKRAENWLFNQSKSDSDLIWYLELDSNAAAQCKITYDSNTRTININADKTLTGSPGNCLTFAKNSYWLQINPNCYGKNFKITCNNDFLTSLIYKTKTDETIFVSATTHTASVNGETNEKVESYCFKEGSTCSYEASLWATLVAQVKSRDIVGYLPYLRALASSNSKYLPSAFLYSLTGFDEYYSDIVNEQKTQGYWQLTDSTKRYYDTAVALRGLYGKESEAYDKSVNYLLTPSVLGNGCWNGGNIRDTAFILYSAYPKKATMDSGTTSSQCEDFSSSGYTCSSSTECGSINGTELADFKCFGGLVCCDKSVPEKSCSQLSGIVCGTDEICQDGLVKPSTDKNICCVGGTCALGNPSVDSCTNAGNTCRSQCLDTEEVDNVNSCGDGVCCSTIPVVQKSYWWVWLLIILVILLALAIIYRNQLKIWWFKMKSKFSKSPVDNMGSRPNFPPQPPMGGMGDRRLMPNQMPQRFPPRPMNNMNNQRPFPKDRELDATLKKIKEIGKQ